MSGNRQYAEILVNGKTGQRHIPLINSIPYLKDWIVDHPHSGNPNAVLICGYKKSLLVNSILPRTADMYKLKDEDKK